MRRRIIVTRSDGTVQVVCIAGGPVGGRATFAAKGAAKAAVPKARWITVWSRRANRYVHIKVEGDLGKRGHRKVTAVRKGSPQHLEDAIAAKLGPGRVGDGKDVSVQWGAPKNARERKFAAKAHESGAVAIAIERRPRTRTEARGDATVYHVGNEAIGEVAPVRPADRMKGPRGQPPIVGQVDTHVWETYASGGRGTVSPHRSREAAVREAERDARARTGELTRDERELIAVRDLDRRDWPADVYDPADWSTTFRLITAD